MNCTQKRGFKPHILINKETKHLWIKILSLFQNKLQKLIIMRKYIHISSQILILTIHLACCSNYNAETKSANETGFINIDTVLSPNKEENTTGKYKFGDTLCFRLNIDGTENMERFEIQFGEGEKMKFDKYHLITDPNDGVSYAFCIKRMNGNKLSIYQNGNLINTILIHQDSAKYIDCNFLNNGHEIIVKYRNGIYGSI